MNSESTDLQILAQEQWAIELLARETDTAIPAVQHLFLLEYRRLATQARIQAFVPLLTCNVVKHLLDVRNAQKCSSPAG